MLVTALKDYLKNFVDSNDDNKDGEKCPRTLLIDGKWGCGKTYSIMDFLNPSPDEQSRKKPSAIYMSLFGATNAERIVLNLSEYLDSSFIGIMDGHYYLKSLPGEEELNGSLIIFDDLERKDDKLSFISIYAMVDHLRRLGFKVVCVCNSKEIKEDERDSYESFKEKTFDNVLFVEIDPNVISNIVKQDINLDDNVLREIDENWRILIRNNNAYERIMENAVSKDGTKPLTDMGVSNEFVFIACVYALKCFYSSSDKTPTFDEDLLETAYNCDCETFGKYIANEFYRLLKREKNKFKWIVRIILECLTKSDYTLFSKALLPDSSDKLLQECPLFEKSVYLLDDASREKYKETFLDQLSEFDFSKERHRRVLLNFVSEFFNELKAKDKNRVVSRTIKMVGINDEKQFYDVVLIDEIEENANIQEFRKLLQKEFDKKNEEEKKAKEAAKSKDKSKLKKYTQEAGKLSSFRRLAAARGLREGVFDGIASPDDIETLTAREAALRFISATPAKSDLISDMTRQYQGTTSKAVRDKLAHLARNTLSMEEVAQILAEPKATKRVSARTIDNGVASRVLSKPKRNKPLRTSEANSLLEPAKGKTKGKKPNKK